MTIKGKNDSSFAISMEKEPVFVSDKVGNRKIGNWEWLAIHFKI